jgi:hypothetical protein
MIGSTLHNPKAFDVEDGTDAFRPWLDNGFDFVSDLEAIRSVNPKKMMKQQRGRSIEPDERQGERAIQRLAVAIEITDRITHEPARVFDFDRFGERAETALAE